MYSEIIRRKEMGFSQRKTARQLGISRNTVRKYWKMEPEDFQEQLIKSKSKVKSLDEYDSIIINWLKTYPDISAAQILDWLKEHYNLTGITGRTVRRCVSELREKYDIQKPIKTRDYQALQQLPPGKQLQLDFGQRKVERASGGSITLYFAAFILAHSRYLYGYFLDRPFKTQDLIVALSWCFDYLEGIPKEIATDQDRLMIVSENNGDIVYTYEFEKYIQEKKIQMYVCRGADPESKGIVESGAVKYIKHSFMPHRKFYDLRSYQELFEEWLERTANKRLHGTIKKVPAEVFYSVEQQYLRPAPHVEISHNPILTRNVNKDNTIWFKSNRYSVPLGTYNKYDEVEIKVDEDDGILRIYDPLESTILIAEHKLSFDKGRLIQNRNHLRDYTHKISELLEMMVDLLGESSRVFLTQITTKKKRYIRDQFMLIKRLTNDYDLEIIQQAVNYCSSNQLYSASDLRDVIAYFDTLSKDEQYSIDFNIEPRPIEEKIYTIKTQKRDIGKYSELVGGQNNNTTTN